MTASADTRCLLPVSALAVVALVARRRCSLSVAGAIRCFAIPCKLLVFCLRPCCQCQMSLLPLPVIVHLVVVASSSLCRRGCPLSVAGAIRSSQSPVNCLYFAIDLVAAGVGRRCLVVVLSSSLPSCLRLIIVVPSALVRLPLLGTSSWVLLPSRLSAVVVSSSFCRCRHSTFRLRHGYPLLRVLFVVV